MNNSVFAKTMGNLRNDRDIKVVRTERRRNYLASEPNYRTTKFFTENLLATEIKKTQILMNKLVNFRLSILKLCKILMYEFQYDYVKPKYGEKAKLCYMDTNIVYIKTDYIYKEIEADVKTRFDISNYNH